MQYLITFLEGLISFISPCMLPMLPIFLSYFAGGDEEEGKKNIVPRAVAFVLGFTAIFSLIGVFAGSLGAFLTAHKTAVNIVSGAIVIVLGLSHLGIIPINLFKGVHRSVEVKGLFSAFLFGVVYSASITPCVGAFLGSAIMMASASGSTLQGLLLLLVYSLGLGIPFILSALLLERLGDTFEFIKKNYNTINKVSGAFLIIVGIAMMLGLLDRLVALV
ncbi:MAG: cytochrome c biogenesis protein CcdA [Clostridiales bacterium]|nr:cytochrome c biogenesis protein CcdA [Clostridiales bacterium]